MTLEWSRGELAEGLRAYRRARFFEAHEYWETVWLRSAEPEKTFLQAIIQIAAALHHLQRNNVQGTCSLLNSATQRLKDYPNVFHGVLVADLRETISRYLEALEGQDNATGLQFPQIRLHGENH